jgi:hypothetical protein
MRSASGVALSICGVDCGGIGSRSVESKEYPDPGADDGEKLSAPNADSDKSDNAKHDKTNLPARHMGPPNKIARFPVQGIRAMYVFRPILSGPNQELSQGSTGLP